MLNDLYIIFIVSMYGHQSANESISPNPDSRKSPVGRLELYAR